MLTLTAYARKRKLSRARIHQLLRAGRIEGAKIIGKQRGGTAGVWIIPPNAKILPPY